MAQEEYKMDIKRHISWATWLTSERPRGTNDKCSLCDHSLQYSLFHVEIMQVWYLNGKLHKVQQFDMCCDCAKASGFTPRFYQ